MRKLHIRYLIFFLISISFSFTAFSETNIHYENPVLATNFKAALQTHGIPFKIQIDYEGKEFVYWNEKHAEQVEILQERIMNDFIGTPPPIERSMRIDDSTKKYIQGIKNSNVPYKVTRYAEVEYIIWNKTDSKKVDEIFEKIVQSFENEINKIAEQAELQSKQYINVPQWSPHSEIKTPLSISEATSIGINWAKNKWPEARGFGVLKIALHPVVKNRKGEWWNYYLTLLPNSYTINEKEPILNEVIIRMNGEVYGYREPGEKNYTQISQETLLKD